MVSAIRRLRREVRGARGEAAVAWITSDAFRKLAATILDEAVLSARLVADQLGHTGLRRPGCVPGAACGDSQSALALEAVLRDALPEDENCGITAVPADGQDDLNGSD